MKKLYLKLLLLLTPFTIVVNAQISAYTFASTSGAYMPITGGTAIRYGMPVTSSSLGRATLDDEVYYNIPIGFSFNYNSTPYTSFGFASNGWITLGSSTTFPNTSVPISIANPSNTISAASLDIIGAVQVQGTFAAGSNQLSVTAGSITRIVVGDSITGTNIPLPGARVTAVTATSVSIDKTVTAASTAATWYIRNGEIRYQTIGNAPNRTLVLQYRGFTRYAATYLSDEMNFQIRLSETSNKVDIVYGTWSSLYTGTLGPLQVGLKGATTSDYTNRTTTTSWSASTAGTQNTSTMRFNSAVLPASGLTYSWTSSTCSAPGSPTITSITSNSATASWYAGGGATGYQYELRTSGAAGSGATGLVTSGNVSALTVNLAGLLDATVYSFYVRTNCGAGNFSAWSSSTFNTLCSPGNIPYSENFDAVTAPAIPFCIVVEDVNGSNAWATAAVNFSNSSAPNVMRYRYNVTTAANDWFFTKGLNLTAGTTYALTFNYSGTPEGLPLVEKLEVRVGTATTSASALAGPRVFVDENIKTPKDGGGTFTPTTTGVYYFGFHVYSAADQNSLLVDNIKVEVAPVAPTCATNIAPTNGALGIVYSPAVNLSWSAVPNATSYDVYLNINNVTSYNNVGTTTATTFALTGLIASTQYYWYVVPKNGINPATGCQANATRFTTAAPPPPPANDNCAGAIAISPYSGTVNGTSLSATASTGIANCPVDPGIPNDDVWYKFTAVQNGGASVSVAGGPAFDGVLQAFSGTCGSLTQIGSCIDATLGGGTETVVLTGLVTGQTYYLRVYDYSNSAGATFTITASGVALPIVMAEFKGEKRGALNALSWTTLTEQNNAGFELQRSADGSNFSSLTFVASKATNGNSTSSLTYSFNDVKPFAGNTYYRLRQLDKDGRSTFTNTVFIKGAKATKIELTNLYPNPTTNAVSLIIASPASDRINIVLTDVTGKIVMQQARNVFSGDNSVTLNVSELSKGNYFIKIVCNNGCESPVNKFVKQ